MGFAKIRITPELLAEMFTEGWSGDNLKCVGGLPAGAGFVCSMLDHGDVALVYAHETFTGSQSGRDLWPDTLPEITVTFHRDYPEDRR